jgi:hypothetical protein
MVTGLSTLVPRFNSTKDVKVLDEVSSLLSLVSILMKIGFNFLSSSSFATFIPRYPYIIQYPLTPTDTVDERPPNSEDTWILFCLLSTKCILEISPDSLAIARDQLITEDIPDILFSTDCSRLLPIILNSLPSILSTSSQDFENACGCLIDLVFNYYSLLSAASVPLSPLHQRCLEIESTDSFEVAQHNHFGEIFPLALSELRSNFLSTFFEFFLMESLILKFPSLSLAFLDHLPIWGSYFNLLLLVRPFLSSPSVSDHRTGKSIFSCQPIF